MSKEKMTNLQLREHLKAKGCLKALPRPSKDKNDTLFEHCSMATNLNYQDTGYVRDREPYSVLHSSLKHVNELQPIRLKQMKLNQIHSGTYLICRTIAKAFCIYATYTVVEDEDDEVENLTLMFTSSCDNLDANIIIPEGSEIIIKEPYIETSLKDCESYSIKIDSPSDLIIVTGTHSIAKWTPEEAQWDIEKLKKEGNQCFVAKKYQKAIDFYQLALKKDGSNKEDLYSNLAAAYLKLEKYYSAYESAIKSPTVKGFYRFGLAAYEMRQYRRAIDGYEASLKLDPNNEVVIKELKRAKQRVFESQTGEYNWDKVITDHEKGVLRHDYADYINDFIEVVDINGKGKGIVARNDIKKGTLLVACKAFSIIFRKECKSPYEAIETEKDPAEINGHLLCNKVANDPFNAREIYKLYAGPKFDRNAIIRDGIVDTNRLPEIFSYNVAMSLPYGFSNASIRNESYEYENFNTGLWITPSYFNHSCVPNARRFFFGNMQIIFAKQDIQKNEEITIKYLYENGIASTLESRNEMLEKYKFICDCKLCKLDRSDPNHKEKSDLCDGYIKQLFKLMDNPRATKKLIEKLKIIEDLYTGRTELRDFICPTYNSIGHNYRLKNEHFKSAHYFIRTYEIAREFDDYISLCALLQAIESFINCGKLEEAEKYFKEIFAPISTKKSFILFQIKQHSIDLKYFNEFLRKI